MKYNSFDELSEVYYKAEEKEENFQQALDILDEGVKLLPAVEVEKHLFNIMMDKCYFLYNCERCNCFMLRKAKNLYGRKCESKH